MFSVTCPDCGPADACVFACLSVVFLLFSANSVPATATTSTSITSHTISVLCVSFFVSGGFWSVLSIFLSSSLCLFLVL